MVRKLAALAALFCIFASPRHADAQALRITIANAGSTGTTLNKLTKVTGAPSTAVIAATTDTSGIIGVTVGGAGTTGNAVIQASGVASCVFDGATTAGHYVQISSGTAGDCHDAGSSYPSGGELIGRVLSTNGSGGTYPVLLSQEVDVAAGGACPSCASQSGVQQQSYSYASGGGTANAQTITLSPALGSYVAGVMVSWLPAAANTTSTPTLNVNGLGTKTIIKVGGAALAASDLTTGAVAMVIYDGTNFELQNPQTAPASGVVKVCSQVAIAMPTSAVTSGAKSSSSTGTCTGLTTSDTIVCSSAVELFGITGFVPSTSGILTINPWPTSNTINVEYENNTGGSVTPGSLTVNCEVTR